MYAWEEQKHI